MRKILAAGALLAALAWCGAAAAQAKPPPPFVQSPSNGICDYGAPANCIKPNTDGSVNVNATVTPSGTQDTNLKQVNGATVNVGTGAASTGTQRVTTSTDSTIGAVTAITNALPAGTNVLGKVGIDQTTPGTTNGVVAPLSSTITNPTSTLQLTSATSAYAAGQLIASSATAGSIVVPSFAIANSAGGVAIPRLRLTTNDATSTAWGGVQVNVDLWSAAPTFSTGDRTTFTPATGTAGHLATFNCTMSAEYGDGAWASCSPAVGSVAFIKLASGTSVFWSLYAVTLSGVTGASKVFTLTAELGN